MTWVLPIFTVINLLLAFMDSRIIGKGRRILHGLNALIYILMVAGPVWYWHNYWLIGALLFNRLLVFNIMLSLFRGLKWNYISPAPTAVTDKITKAIFGNRGSLMYGVYLVAFITFIILTYAI